MTLEKRGKRTEIADAALRLIGTRGITELTMANLAEELGVTSGSFFRHFKSRDEILVEVARRVAELVEATFPDPDLPPLERLERLFRARTEVLGRQSGIARLIFSEQFTKALPPEAVAHIHGVVKRTRACLLEALREAAETGQIRRDIPPEDLLLPVIGTLQHLGFLTALTPGGAYPRRPATSRVLGTLLTLIGATPAGPRDGLPVQARKEDRMRPTAVLMHEHEAVLAALEVLEGAGQALASGRQGAARDLDALLDFFRGFVDHCHHGKEERVLFPELVNRGVPREGGPVGVMLSEHELGRDHVRRIQALLDAGDGAQALPVIHSYRGLLASHIQKENSVLFPMADQLLDEARAAEMSLAFDRIELEHAGEGRHEAYHRMLRALKERYLA